MSAAQTFKECENLNNCKSLKTLGFNEEELKLFLGAAVIYTRVSTTKQLEGFSLENQEGLCKEYCEKNKFKVLKIFSDEARSGKDFDRPQYTEMKNFLKKGMHVIVVNTSRLGRNALQVQNEVSEMKLRGCVFHAINQGIRSDNKDQNLMLQIHSAFDESVRQTYSERTKQTMRYARISGQLRTKPLFGFRLNKETKKYEEIPEQQQCLKLIKQLWEEGTHTVSQITQKIAEAGFRTKKDNKFGQSFISSLINRIETKERDFPEITEEEQEN